MRGSFPTHWTVALAACALAGAAGAAVAQNVSAQAARLDHADRAFLEKAAQGNIAEVETGRLLEQHATDPAVKRFAERMIHDHTKANDELASVAQNLGVELPTKPDRMDEHELMRLQAMSGEPAKLDSTYSHTMVQDHKMDIREYEHEVKAAQNPQVRAYAEQTLPTLKEHLALAEQLPANQGTAAR
ncbi:MAG TPA: DUF4142 domain-containing protein [Steroidobacteraceae bacterium]|nr:DUF4142 domain-containing protein [Steroidobacteraceae bacterium]